MDYQQAVTQINLRYVTWMMNRQNMFRTQIISATDQLPIGLHYGLSLLTYLALSLAPFFMVIFDANWIVAQRRFRTAARGSGVFYGASFTAYWLVVFLLLTAAQLALFRNNLETILLTSALCALFCAASGGFSCLLTADTGNCGLLSFGSSLVFLALSGGILPPVLMPQVLRNLIPCWPVTWFRNLMAISADDVSFPISSTIALVSASLLMMVLSRLLYHHRGKCEVTQP